MLSSGRRRRLSLYLSLRRRRLGTAGEVEAEFSSRRVARKGERMSFMKGLAKAEPVWLKAMQQAPPALFPRADEIKQIALPEDVYVEKFFQKYLDSKHEHAINQRVLELKESGVSEEEAMAVADMDRLEKKGNKQAYARLKQIAKFQGKRPPPNPYPSAIKEIQAEERKYVRDRFHNPKIRKIIEKMKEEKAAEAQYRTGGGGN